MKEITIKKTTYDLVQTHASGLFKFKPEHIEFLGDSVLIKIEDSLHKRLSDHVDTRTPSIDKVIVSLCTTMDHT